MRTDISIQFEDEPRLIPVIERYTSGGRPAVFLYDADNEELWCDLTVNLPDCVVSDPVTDSFVPAENRRYLDALVARGLAEVIGEARYGCFGSRAAEVRFSDQLLESQEA